MRLFFDFGWGRGELARFIRHNSSFSAGRTIPLLRNQELNPQPQ